ncbi:hypothetical protein C6I20_16740 [Aeromicrobium sp. A1-2]|uniref:hypothetical protein n=1 Tax=Aeromicrobium sp. A1-2 TaxID=2107713 RepID=UPI000E4709AF|nr:hypothetical protein [Aeromicrobium sp. A1-2]AXT86651.1 hypothetical protein C6I20_16740 [Aeromicrobium sp. A1-2]
MQHPRRFAVLVTGEALVVIAYVLAIVIDPDVSSLRTPLRVIAVAGAVIIAVTLYQAWSTKSTAVSLAGMLTALLGGACLASTAISATGDRVFASTPVATLGTAALVAAVVLGQVTLAQNGRPNP